MFLYVNPIFVFCYRGPPGGRGYYSPYPSRPRCAYIRANCFRTGGWTDGDGQVCIYIGGWILWGYGRHFIFRHTVRFGKAHCPCACPSDVLGRNSNSLLQLLLHFIHASRLLPPVQTRPRGDQQPPQPPEFPRQPNQRVVLLSVSRVTAASKLSNRIGPRTKDNKGQDQVSSQFRNERLIGYRS